MITAFPVTLVGCGDSVVAANVEIPYTTGVLRAAMNKLLSIKDQNYGELGLYNALYQSSLKISSLSLKDEVATIHLTGKMTLGGECDNPRVQAQLEETALQFSTVKKVVIYINNVELKKALSLKIGIKVNFILLPMLRIGNNIKFTG